MCVRKIFPTKLILSPASLSSVNVNQKRKRHKNSIGVLYCKYCKMNLFTGVHRLNLAVRTERKRKYAEEKTTVKLKNKGTSIASVPD